MKKILTVLFLSLLLIVGSNLPDKPRGEYNQSREWNDYILQMIVVEADNYIKAAENKIITDEEAIGYYREAMDHIPNGYNDERRYVLEDISSITFSISMNDLEETKREAERIKYVYGIND